MLVANETVAEHFHWMNVPFIYRIHEDPKPEKLQRFFEFVTNFGLVIKGSGASVHPKALQAIIEKIEGLPEEPVISTMLLRSLQQAKYSAESLGHFGLSAEFYTHFTSPIRRYPDLIVHRLIRTYLVNGDTSNETIGYWKSVMDEIADHTSSRERRAVDAERDVDALKKAQFMLDKVGEEFTGIVSSVTNFGMFIELENTIEGLVHMRNMNDDYYRFDDRSMSLIGERTARQFRIGDEVRIKVTAVNLDESAIDFEVVGMVSNRERRRVEAPRVIDAGRKRRRPEGGTRKREEPGKKPEKRLGSSKSVRAGRRKDKKEDPRGAKKSDGPKFYERIVKKKKKKKK